MAILGLSLREACGDMALRIEKALGVKVDTLMPRLSI